MNRFYQIIKYLFTPLKVSFITALLIHIGILTLGENLIIFEYNQPLLGKEITFKLNHLEIISGNDANNLEQVKEKNIVEKEHNNQQQVNKTVKEEVQKVELTAEKSVVAEDISSDKNQKNKVEPVNVADSLKSDMEIKINENEKKSIEETEKEEDDSSKDEPIRNKEIQDNNSPEKINNVVEKSKVNITNYNNTHNAKKIFMEDEKDYFNKESIIEDIAEDKVQINDQDISIKNNHVEEIKETDLLEELKSKALVQKESVVENNKNKSSSEDISQLNEVEQIRENKDYVENENKEKNEKKTDRNREEIKKDFKEKDKIRLDLTKGIPDQGINPPEIADYQPPSYPEQMRKRGIEGKVILKILIDSNGSVVQIEVKETSGYIQFDTEAQETVGNWKFKPTTQDGINVESWILVPIVFKLR